MDKSVARAAMPPTQPAASAQGLLQRQCACGTHALGGECEKCARGKQSLQRKGAGGDAPSDIPPSVHEVLGSSGQPIDQQTRARMEAHFHRDFSHVRIHSDGRAAQSARALDALAYTVGPHVVMGAGQHRPQTTAGQHLLAHELTHVLQQDGAASAAGIQQRLALGASDSAEEHEAERAADSLVAGHAVAAIGAAGRGCLRRAPVPGEIGWKGASGLNAKKSTVKEIERIPLDKLSVGHQAASGSGGQAIVLKSPKLDASKPVDVLLHFHGYNPGHAEVGAEVRDDKIDQIEAQLASSQRPQLMAILPQGTQGAEFGVTAQPGGKPDKSFDPDAYVANIFAVLSNLGIWKSKPPIAGVAISGHSGAGGLINEKILGAALGSGIGAGALPTAGSAAPAAFKELILIDAVNGPREHARLTEFLKMKMQAELARALKKGSDDERETALKSGFKFRGYYSHGPAIGIFYSQWYVGPVVHKQAVYTDSLRTVIDEFLKTNANALGGTNSKAYQAFKNNYDIIDAGVAAHPKMVAERNYLADALSVLPKREDGFPPGQPAAIPRTVADALHASGKPLDDASLGWANRYFARDMSRVRIHDDDRSAASARAIHAKAYTAGRDVVFGRGRYAPGTREGRRLLAHELTHVIQQGQVQAGAAPLALGATDDALEAQAERVADGAASMAPAVPGGLSAPSATPAIRRAPDDAKKTVDAALCEENASPHPAALSDCSYKAPENCPTYEGWIGSFARLKARSARDTPLTQDTMFKVLGDLASSEFHPIAPEPGPAPPPKVFAPLKPGERFIDHPTDKWVRTCLPENLRATAYQLPADCADVAMILRHVWLAAHHRTQVFGQWVLGSKAGTANETAVLNVITNAGTEQVANLLAPYSDAQGRPLRSIV